MKKVRIRSKWLRKSLGIIAAFLMVASVCAFLGQTPKTTKSKSGQSKSAPPKKKGPMKYDFTWGGKVYKITSEKELPVADMNATILRAASATALERQLASAQDQVRLLRSLNSSLQAQNQQLTDDAEEKETELDELKEKAEEVRSAFSDFDFEFGRLKRAIGSFSYQDWKYVVPDVEHRFRMLGLEFDSLESAINDLPPKQQMAGQNPNLESSSSMRRATRSRATS